MAIKINAMKTHILNIVLLFVAYIGNLSASSHKENAGAKSYSFYYYPKFNIYYSKESKKWYTQSGCVWVITKTPPKNIPLYKVLFSRRRLVVSATPIPFKPVEVKANARVQKKPKKQYQPSFTVRSYYKSNNGGTKVEVKSYYRSQN